MRAVQADGTEITTIEGMANGGLHPLQEAFHAEHALQCGYCTPEMIMAASDLLRENPHPSDEEIREGLEGNLCRCTGGARPRPARAAGAELDRARGIPVHDHRRPDLRLW